MASIDQHSFSMLLTSMSLIRLQPLFHQVSAFVKINFSLPIQIIYQLLLIRILLIIRFICFWLSKWIRYL